MLILKRQSKHSGFRPDTSSLVTFYHERFELFLQVAGSGVTFDYKIGF